MLFDKFIQETFNRWTKYYQFLSENERKGNLNLQAQIILYPNILLVTNCNGYYVAELVGATEKFEGLSIKKHTEKSIYRYLSQFDDSTPDPVIELNTHAKTIAYAGLAHEADLETLKSRFPYVEYYPLVLNRAGGHGSTIAFGKDFASCVIENSILINKKQSIFRCKSILSMFVVKSSISSSELIELFSNTTREGELMGRIIGVHISPKNRHRLIVGSQLQNIYLFPKLRETTIGEFIKLHPNVVKEAFKTNHFEYEPHLKWIEHNKSCTDDAINPDLLIRRPDGFYDIYDLKTALLERKRITQDKRNRRRFIDYVSEGLAQLANYEEYFQYPANAEYAKKTYGIKVCDPKLVLILGSWENYNIDEVTEALRMHKENINIIDYDSLCHIFMGTSIS